MFAINLKIVIFSGECVAIKVERGALIVMKGEKKVARLHILQGYTVVGDAIIINPT